MAHKLRVNGIVEESVADGPGLRYVVFTQGCPHNCRGCHNPETHDPAGGYDLRVDDICVAFTENPLLSGITFSGGEPFLQPEPLCLLAEYAHRLHRNVITYSGFTFERLLLQAETNPFVGRLLDLTDVLIDGPYIEARRDLELPFRGSANQRMLTRADRDALRRRESPSFSPAARVFTPSAHI